jgi:Subtilisin inhibitor-like
MGYRMLFYVVPGLAATALALSACGSSQPSAASTQSKSSASPSGAPGASTPPASSSPSTPAATQLTVHYAPDAGKPAKVWTLTCDPTGGDHPYAQQSCDLLAKAAASGTDPFAKTRVGVMCTMIFGGPQTATVTGTWRGKPVNASFSRKNGCEIKRWDTASPLVGELPRTTP